MNFTTDALTKAAVEFFSGSLTQTTARSGIMDMATSLSGCQAAEKNSSRFFCETGVFVTSPNPLPYYMVEQGFEVWLINPRGRPTPKHVNLSGTDGAFWKWTWQDMALFDVPAAVDHILQVSGHDRLNAWIAWSQGGLVGYAAFATPNWVLDAEGVPKVKLFVPLAGEVYPPVAAGAEAASQMEEGGLVESRRLASTRPGSTSLDLCPRCSSPTHWLSGCCSGGWGETNAEAWLRVPEVCTRSI